MKSGETLSDHTWSDGLAWSTNICQPRFHPLSDPPGQIELPGQPTSASLHFSLYLTPPGQIVLPGQPTSTSQHFFLYLTTPGQIVLPGQPTSASLHFSLYLTTPGQIENIGALSTTGLTLLTSGLVD